MHLSFLLVAGQMDHFVLVACHQAFVANGGFLEKKFREKEQNQKGMKVISNPQCVCVMCLQTHTGREYMALIVSLNCMVAVTKMASVAESDFPLERKSFTCVEPQKQNITVNHDNKFRQLCVNILLLVTHLVAQKLVKVSQLISVCDFSIKRGVPLLRDPCGTTDFDGVLAA